MKWTCYVLITLLSCAGGDSFDKDRQALLQLHKQQQDAHMNKGAALFVSQFTDPMIQVNRGAVSRTLKEDNKKQDPGLF